MVGKEVKSNFYTRISSLSPNLSKSDGISFIVKKSIQLELINRVSEKVLLIMRLNLLKQIMIKIAKQGEVKLF